MKKWTEPEECPSKITQESLMTKYRIPVHHFEYSYIEKCEDGKELEKIVQVLRSGQEGCFPDLTQFAENRLSVIKPKSKLLRKVCPAITKEALSKEERNELTEDLTQWVANVSKDDDGLVSYKNRKADRTLPEVRETKEKMVNENKKKLPNRIASTDYSSWNKYDVDTEILKIDLEEENMKKSQKEKKKNSSKKTVQFKEFTTDIEALHQANYEKDKGNEFFKAGDYKEALRHYTNSINCKPILASFTNRALTNIKLKNYKNAIDDCHSALAIDPDNVKSLVRKAQALDGLEQHHEALETIERAIKIDPNNNLAQDLAVKLRKQSGVILKNTRFKVEDIENEEKGKVIIPIPGTSSMSPPYYITCSENNPERVKEEIIRVNTPSQIVHLISIDNSDAEDDYCTVNHLKSICTNNNTSSEVHNKSKDIETNLNDRINELQVENVNKKNSKEVMKDDKHAGGEPYIKDNESIDMPEDIHSPYSFLKTWNSTNFDKTLEQHASILRSIDMNRIVDVIGCKLDNAMLSTIVKCLCVHFAVPGEVERLHFILENIVKLPRFDIISMMMSSDDRNCVNVLVNFLKQHGKCVSQEVINKFFN
ncbi:RPAP3 C and/or TPR 11 domain containing protein [Asbolus verrucosus]|uniref:RPAP3 C and/or TPR 11 domain containing protein n=1 Tax=Asbolus verrucosus TaxID=1661398 RepID=A0A482W7C7_ASBVE|nr:RPAP3 C and/or TPR 11 domain containing protein [Asbolus verrucosus]